MSADMLFRFINIIDKFIFLYFSENVIAAKSIHFSDITILQILEYSENRFMFFLKYKNTYFRIWESDNDSIEFDYCNDHCLNFYGYDYINQGLLRRN